MIAWLFDVNIPFVSACLYFHSELALSTFIHKSWVVCLKVFFERRFLKVSIATLATVFALHELNKVLLINSELNSTQLNSS